MCPVTTQEKGYPFEVSIPPNLPIKGVVLVDHLRSVDWQGRKAEFICALPQAAIDEAIRKLRSLL